MAYRLLYSQTFRDQMRSLHPKVTPVVKGYLEKLKENPFLGKPLEKDLSGYYSLRRKRFRIIYRLDHSHKLIQVHYGGHRRDVYELFREALNRERKA